MIIEIREADILEDIRMVLDQHHTRDTQVKQEANEENITITMVIN